MLSFTSSGVRSCIGGVCSHTRSELYFVNSIREPELFGSKTCATVEDCNNQIESGTEVRDNSLNHTSYTSVLGPSLHGGECSPVLHGPEDHVPQLRGGWSLVLLRTQSGLVLQTVVLPVLFNYRNKHPYRDRVSFQSSNHEHKYLCKWEQKHQCNT